MSAADAVIGENPGKQFNVLNAAPLSDDDESDDENDERTGASGGLCGFPFFRPHWLQRFASVRWFVLDFVLQGIVQGMFYTCWVSSVSTIEKRFHLPSKMMGLTGSFGEIGYVATVFCFAHYGGTGHRPRWLAVGVLLMGIAALCIALPEIIAPALDDTTIVATRAQEADTAFVNANSTVQRHMQHVCVVDNNSVVSKNTTCNENTSSASATSLQALTAFGIFVLGWIMMNAGTPSGPTVGMPFIYDSVELKNSPMYFAVTFLGRILGPFLGFSLGSACLSLYTTLRSPDGLSRTSPQWIGAWWLGFLVIGALQFLISFTLFAFPRTLHGSLQSKKAAAAAAATPLKNVEKNSNNRRTYNDDRPPDKIIKFRDIPKALKTVVLNPTLMLIAVGRSIDIFGSIGLWLFEPKYVENQFRVSAAQANMLLATTMILSFGVGSMVGAEIIRRWKLRPRGIAILIAIFSILNALGFFVIMQLQCADGHVQLFGFTKPTLQQPFTATQRCNSDCNCAALKSLAPVCDEYTGISYPTACYAGCTEYSAERNVFRNCSCADGRDVRLEYCQGPCSIWIYAGASMLNALMGGLTLVGGIMIVFAVVEPEQKSMAQAVISLMVTMLGFLPGAPLMGMFIDNTCLLWSTKTSECGAPSSVGNCLFYDIDRFRHAIFGLTGGARLFGCLFDVVLVWLVRHVNFPGRNMNE